MPNKPLKPGPKKGVARKPKRALDVLFSDRLRASMALHPKWTTPTLAAEAECTRAVLGKDLNGQSKSIEALLLFKIAELLQVSAEWLLTGRGQMGQPRQLSHDEERALNILSMLTSTEYRDLWISQGEQLAHIQPPLLPSPGNPYRIAAPRTSPAFRVHEPTGHKTEKPPKKNAPSNPEQ